VQRSAAQYSLLALHCSAAVGPDSAPSSVRLPPSLRGSPPTAISKSLRGNPKCFLSPISAPQSHAELVHPPLALSVVRTAHWMHTASNPPPLTPPTPLDSHCRAPWALTAQEPARAPPIHPIHPIPSSRSPLARPLQFMRFARWSPPLRFTVQPRAFRPPRRCFSTVLAPLICARP
jgi:hypothetical protein